MLRNLLMVGEPCSMMLSFYLSRPSGPSKALKLGAKGKEVDNFVDKLKSEGETIMPTTGKPSDGPHTYSEKLCSTPLKAGLPDR